MLKVITDAMAITDLHRDNIIPTLQNMPLIIDAEVGFFNYTTSGLENDALVEDEYEGRFTNSSFEVVGEHKRSGELFKDKTSNYYKSFEKGYEFMLNKMNSQKDIFANLYKSQLNNVHKVRILPIKTAEFAQFLHGYIISDNKKEDDALFVANEIEKKLCETIGQDTTDNFIFSKANGLKIHIYKSELKKATKVALDNYTIIALYADMNGKLYLNDIEIGKMVAFKGSLDINKDLIKNVMKRNFLRVIEELNNELQTKKTN